MEFSSAAMNPRHQFCLRCEHEGWPRTVTPGAFLIEVVLWLCFLVPGVIYSLWRHSARHQVCASCGSREIVPVLSPAALKRRGGSAPIPTAAARPVTLAAGATSKFCPQCGQEATLRRTICARCGHRFEGGGATPTT